MLFSILDSEVESSHRSVNHIRQRKMFRPEEHGLRPDFRLTKFSTLRGWGCKVPQELLNKFLAGVELLDAQQMNIQGGDDKHRVGAFDLTDKSFSAHVE